ncbi:MAG: MGMT family protein [Anaerolineae bacterium]|nr:MGMT family protein [Anaerolineae bacterium]
MNEKFAEVYALVRQIPPGKVATYGQIARLLGWPRGARTVGWALRALPPEEHAPWHRVVNAKGQISLFDAEEQRARLETEGVVFDAQGRIDLMRFGWAPDDAEA